MIRTALVLAFTALAVLPLRAATDIDGITTPGGLTVWLVEEHAIPIISIELSFEGGSSLDPEGQSGATNLAIALLEEGAGTRDAAAFARETESLAAQFSFNAERDTVHVSATMLSENRDQVIALLHEALTAPRFDADAIGRVRAQILSGIRSDATDPDEIAGRVFREQVFPADPYGLPQTGSEQSVSSLTRADLVAAHQRLLVRSRVRIGIVGDVTAQEAAALTDALLEGLPEEGPDLPGEAPTVLSGGVTIEEFDAPQSVVMFAQRGLDRHDPDFFAAYLLNHILGGGGFSSRLTVEVREKRGLTYGVYSYLAGYNRADLWMGGVASANERVAEAIAVIREEWARIAREGVSAEELAAAQRYLTGAYPLRFDTNGKIADILVGVQEEDLGIDYTRNRNALIEAVTLADVNRVARERLDANALRFVVVGHPVGLEPVN